MTRQKARKFGLFAETLCTWALRARGYSILVRNHQTGVGELDIVARRANMVVFMEVKARKDFETAAQALPARQRRRLENASQLFLSRRADLEGCDMRFDLALVMPWKLPRFIENAWQAGE